MGSGPARVARVCVVAVCTLALAATAAAAASQTADTTIARTGIFVASDFPAGFQASPAPSTTHADQIAMAKGVDGCSPYVTMQKRIMTMPEASSMQYSDGTRTFVNAVVVFSSDKSAGSLLGLVTKPSMVGCLENYLEKQFRQSARGQVDDIDVELARQDIAGLGDDSVVYEGTGAFLAANGTTTKIGIGNVTVRVGRALDSIIYFTTGPAVVDDLTPAIDASVTRLRTALARSA